MIYYPLEMVTVHEVCERGVVVSSKMRHAVQGGTRRNVPGSSNASGRGKGPSGVPRGPDGRRLPYVAAGWQEVEDGSEIGWMSPDGDESALAAFDLRGDSTATLRGAWEEVSSDVDLFAGTWYSKEEFLQMFFNNISNGGEKGKSPGCKDKFGMKGGEERNVGDVGLHVPAGPQHSVTRVQDIEVCGERLGDIWAFQVNKYVVYRVSIGVFLIAQIWIL
jgi:hypothetical protein